MTQEKLNPKSIKTAHVTAVNVYARVSMAEERPGIRIPNSLGKCLEIRIESFYGEDELGALDKAKLLPGETFLNSVEL